MNSFWKVISSYLENYKILLPIFLKPTLTISYNRFRFAQNNRNLKY